MQPSTPQSAPCTGNDHFRPIGPTNTHGKRGLHRRLVRPHTHSDSENREYTFDRPSPPHGPLRCSPVPPTGAEELGDRGDKRGGVPTTRGVPGDVKSYFNDQDKLRTSKRGHGWDVLVQGTDEDVRCSAAPFPWVSEGERLAALLDGAWWYGDGLLGNTEVEPPTNAWPPDEGLSSGEEWFVDHDHDRGQRFDRGSSPKREHSADLSMLGGVWRWPPGERQRSHSGDKGKPRQPKNSRSLRESPSGFVTLPHHTDAACQLPGVEPSRKGHEWRQRSALKSSLAREDAASSTGRSRVVLRRRHRKVSGGGSGFASGTVGGRTGPSPAPRRMTTEARSRLRKRPRWDARFYIITTPNTVAAEDENPARDSTSPSPAPAAPPSQRPDGELHTAVKAEREEAPCHGSRHACEKSRRDTIVRKKLDERKRKHILYEIGRQTLPLSSATFEATTTPNDREKRNRTTTTTTVEFGSSSAATQQGTPKSARWGDVSHELTEEMTCGLFDSNRRAMGGRVAVSSRDDEGETREAFGLGARNGGGRTEMVISELCTVWVDRSRPSPHAKPQAASSAEYKSGPATIPPRQRRSPRPRSVGSRVSVSGQCKNGHTGKVRGSGGWRDDGEGERQGEEEVDTVPASRGLLLEFVWSSGPKPPTLMGCSGAQFCQPHEQNTGESSALCLPKRKQENERISYVPSGELGNNRSGGDNRRRGTTSGNRDKKNEKTPQTATRMSEASKTLRSASYPENARSAGCNREEYPTDRPGGIFLVLTLGFLRRLVALASVSADGSSGHPSSTASLNGQGSEHASSRGELRYNNATRPHDDEYEIGGRRWSSNGGLGGGGNEYAAAAEYAEVLSDLTAALRNIHAFSFEQGGLHGRLIDAMSPTLCRNLVPLITEAFEPPPGVIIRACNPFDVGWNNRRVDDAGGGGLFCAHGFAASGNSEIASFLGSTVRRLLRCRDCDRRDMNVASATSATDDDGYRGNCSGECRDRRDLTCACHRHRSRVGLGAARIDDEKELYLKASHQDLYEAPDSAYSWEDAAGDSNADRTKNPSWSSQDPWDADRAVATASYLEHERDAVVATGAGTRGQNQHGGGLVSRKKSTSCVSPCHSGRSLGPYSSDDLSSTPEAKELGAGSCVVMESFSANAVDSLGRGYGEDEVGVQDGELISSIGDNGGAEADQGTAVVAQSQADNVFPRYSSGEETEESYGASTFTAEDPSLRSSLVGGHDGGLKDHGGNDNVGDIDGSDTGSYSDDSWAAAEDFSAPEGQQPMTKPSQRGGVKPDCCHSHNGVPFLEDAYTFSSYHAGGKHLAVLAEMQRANTHIEFPGLAQDARKFADLLVRLAEGSPMVDATDKSKTAEQLGDSHGD